MLELAKKIKDIIDDKKGEDITIIDISEKSGFADFFVNATATNERMLDAIIGEIDKKLHAEHDLLPKGIEGRPSSGWLLMDYGDIIINIFLPEQRQTYNIDKIWSDGILVD
ncbi:MAG: ribosome silencing factor [Clostridiales Family XIII bacterium]|jgi:ribosome-associated protein|nr:ribosome silencing factor [Clostridiales Family XIII bacterium]